MKNLFEATFTDLKKSFSSNKNQKSFFPHKQKGMSKKEMLSIKGGEDIVIADIIGG